MVFYNQTKEKKPKQQNTILLVSLRLSSFFCTDQKRKQTLNSLLICRYLLCYKSEGNKCLNPRLAHWYRCELGNFTTIHFNYQYPNINNTLICDEINGLIGRPDFGINTLFTKLTYLAPHIRATQKLKNLKKKKIPNKNQHTLSLPKLILKEGSKLETELSYNMV